MAHDFRKSLGVAIKIALGDVRRGQIFDLAVAESQELRQKVQREAGELRTTFGAALAETPARALRQ